MIKKDKHRFADGSVKTQVRVIHAYRPYPGAAPKHRTVKSFGYLEDQPDAEAFWKEVEAFNAGLPSLQTQAVCSRSAERIDLSRRNSLNYGYKFLDAAYRDLNLRGMFSEDMQEGPFRYLTADQILYPGSVRDSLQRVGTYYGTGQYGIDASRFYLGIGSYASGYGQLQGSLAEAAAKAGYSNLPESLCAFSEPQAKPRSRQSPVLHLGLCCDGDLAPICPVPLVGDPTAAPAIAECVKEAFGLTHAILVAQADGPDFSGVADIRDVWDGYVLYRGLDESDDSVRVPDLDRSSRVWVDREETLDNLFSSGPGEQRILLAGTKGGEPSRKDRIAVATDVSGCDPEGFLRAVHTHFRLDNSFRELNPNYTAKIPYLGDGNRITGYFMAVETGLFLVRMIQGALKPDKMSPTQLRKALRAANCLVLDQGGFVILLDMADTPGAAEDYGRIQACFGTDFYYFCTKQELFNRFCRNMKLQKNS